MLSLGRAQGIGARGIGAVSVAVVVAVAAGVLVVDGLRLPSYAFADRGDGSVVTRPAGARVWYGVTASGEGQEGTVTLRGATARIDEGRRRADVRFAVCRVARGRGIVAIGSVADLQPACAEVEPVEGARIDLQREPAEQLVMGLAVDRPGRVHVRAVDVAYRRGGTPVRQTVLVDGRSGSAELSRGDWGVLDAPGASRTPQSTWAGWLGRHRRVPVTW